MAAPKLQLDVTLNLAAFRKDLGKVAQAAAAYYYPVNLLINKKNFEAQLKALSKIKPVINIEDSQLIGARTRIATLNKSLATLRRATSTPIEIKVKYKEEGAPASGASAIGRAVTGRTTAQQALESKSRGELQKLYGLFREANLRVGELSKSLAKSSADEIKNALIPAFSDSGEEAVNGLAVGLKDPSSKVSKAAERLAKTTIQDIKKAFGIASPSRVFKEIGQDIVEGLELGLEDFNTLRTKMVGEMRQFITAIKREARVGGIALGGLLSPITRPTGSSTRTVPGIASPTRAGASTDPGRGNQRILNSLSLLTGNPALYRGRMANLGAGRLPSSLLGAAQNQFDLEELAPSFKQARLASGVSPLDKIIDEAFFGRGTLPKAQSALSTLNNSLERLGNAAKAALPSGILQSASGNPRMRAFGGVAPSQTMGVFQPTARQTAYPPSGGFLEFSRRATAISAGLPGNVFGGRDGGGGGGGRGSGGFPSDGMMGGRQGPATFIGAGSQMEKFKTALDVASASTNNFRASQIPLIGGIKNLAGEFGEATKQVLLYGTAYKGLAFLTSLPGQVLNAAKSQQQFNNALQTATQDTGTFAKELLYVDNVQRAFGLNLETTRTGFTRLYASMAPTGFDSGSIEKLFTGISAATAALQLTPDKAERVIYAFGQMASKGQIMSEELKGQLGDVLPGALAIFSKAAGMSVKEFSEAMEDGEFKGQRFREVFAKVSDELMNRFGTGAQAAGKSLQGLINTVGGDFQRTLESFAPLANAAAQATLGPLAGMLKEVSMAAQIAMGEQDRVRKQLETAQADVSALKAGGADPKEIKAAEQNVAALTARYESLNEAAKDPAIAQQVKNIEAFVIEIQKAATFTKNLAGVIGSVLSPVFTFLGGNLTSVIGNLALFALAFNAVKLAALLVTGTLALVNATALAGGNISVVAAAKNTILAGVFRLIGVQATGASIATLGFSTAVKVLLASTGVGLLVVLLGSVATAFLSVGNSAKEAADKAKRSIDSMKDAARTGNVAIIDMDLAINKAEREDLESLIESVEKLKGRKGARQVELVTLTPAQRRAAKQLGVEVNGEVSKGITLDKLKALRAPLQEQATEGQQSRKDAVRRAEKLGLNKPDPAATQAEDALQDTKKTNLESYDNLQDTLAKNFTQAEIDRLQSIHDQRMALQNEFFNQQEARANSFQKESIKFQRELAAIENERKSALLKASLEVMKAQGSVAGGASSAETGGKSLANGIAQYITGDPSSPFYAADHGGGNYHEHLAFVSRQAAEDAYNKLTSAGIQVTEFKGKGPVGRHTPGSAHDKGLAFDVPGAQVPVGQERELTARVQSILGIGGGGVGAPRKVPGSEKRDLIAAQQVQIANSQKIATSLSTEELAYEKTKTAIANYVASIFSPEEQALQNSLLAKRGELIRAGMDEDAIELEMKRYEIQEKVNIGLIDAKKALDENKIKQKGYNDLVAKLNNLLPASNKLLGEQNALLQSNAYQKRIADLREEIKLLLIINDEERRLAELTKEFKGDKAKAQEVFDLEKIKENIEKTRALIGDFVSSTSSDYKGFLKAVISGEDAADALQQFQEGLKDRVLTIFLDFAMAPVEKFLKESLEGLFLPKAETIPGTDISKAITKDPVEATNGNTNATVENTVALREATAAFSGAAGGGQSTSALNAAMQSIGGVAFDTNVGTGNIFGNPEALKETFASLQGSLSESMLGISSSFESATSSIAGTLPAWNDALQGFDAAATQLPDSLKKATDGTNKETPKFQESLGKVAQGIGIAAGAIIGIAAGISQIKKGGAGNVLMGIGSILGSVGGAIGGFASLGKAANGAVWKGGFQAFANGGMVTSPTLGLVGEGKYNEAIVPLPDGRSIPVQMQGESIRDKMGGRSMGGAAASPVLSMSFQSTTINGVEYVDRAQLEAAMNETRRMATREGATRGANLALDKLANSPSSRRRVGLR